MVCCHQRMSGIASPSPGSACRPHWRMSCRVSIAMGQDIWITQSLLLQLWTRTCMQSETYVWLLSELLISMEMERSHKVSLSMFSEAETQIALPARAGFSGWYQRLIPLEMGISLSKTFT